MDSDDVRGYYAQFGEREWFRLELAEGVVELAVTTAAEDPSLHGISPHLLYVGHRALTGSSR